MNEFLKDFRLLKPQYQKIGSCEIEISRPFGLVIFGAAGNLAKRKLIPSIYHLYFDGLLPENSFIYGADRIGMNTAEYRGLIKEEMQSISSRSFDESSWNRFCEKVYYTSFDFSSSDSYTRALERGLADLEKKHGTGGNRIFYLAVPPGVFENVIHNIGLTGLGKEDNGYAHLVIEKPFGHDFASAQRLNRVVRQYFNERQIFRIDHYVAKETVQNMLMFRFANSIFEPLWNRRYIDHVQITVAEDIGIDQRAGYYENAGVIRDMFQSHLFQLLAVTAMEPPVAFQADRVRDEKIKVFRSIRQFPLESIHEHVAVGQYGKGIVHGQPVVSYRQEAGVSPESVTFTYAAMKVYIDSWRWNGVPFYLRSGKRLPVRKTEISIHFKQVPHMMFSRVMEDQIEPNTLVFRLQPDEGISLVFQTKRPGTRVCLNPVRMDFSYLKDVSLDAYEWVLLDCILGDQMLFLRQEGVEETWSLLTPLIERLEESIPKDTFPNYDAGSSGPKESDRLIERDGRTWRPIENAGTPDRQEISRFRGHQQ